MLGAVGHHLLEVTLRQNPHRKYSLVEEHRDAPRLDENPGREYGIIQIKLAPGNHGDAMTDRIVRAMATVAFLALAACQTSSGSIDKAFPFPTGPRVVLDKQDACVLVGKWEGEWFNSGHVVNVGYKKARFNFVPHSPNKDFHQKTCVTGAVRGEFIYHNAKGIRNDDGKTFFRSPKGYVGYNPGVVRPSGNLFIVGDETEMTLRSVEDSCLVIIYETFTKTERYLFRAWVKRCDPAFKPIIERANRSKA